MTVIDRESYLEGRRQGIYPKNGSVPDEVWRKATTDEAPLDMSVKERHAELHRMLALAWDYPSRQSAPNLHQRIFELTGEFLMGRGGMGDACRWARHVDGKPVHDLKPELDQKKYVEWMEKTASLGRDALRPEDIKRSAHPKHVQWLLEEHDRRLAREHHGGGMRLQLVRFLGPDAEFFQPLLDEASRHATWMRENPSELPPNTQDRAAYDYVMAHLKNHMRSRR